MNGQSQPQEIQPINMINQAIGEINKQLAQVREMVFALTTDLSAKQGNGINPNASKQNEKIVEYNANKPVR